MIFLTFAPRKNPQPLMFLPLQQPYGSVLSCHSLLRIAQKRLPMQALFFPFCIFFVLLSKQ
jgi:hypothetical protein